MIKEVSFWDRVMYGALLVLVIFVPYSSAMIQASLMVMMLSWIIKRSLQWRAHPQNGFRASYSLPYVSIQWPLIVIGLLIFLTIPFSHAPALSLKKFFSRFLQQIALMYLVLEVVKTPKRLFQVLAMLVWTLLVVNADIFVQYFRGESFIFSTRLIYQRVTGPMRHPNDLGTLLVTVLPMVLGLFMTVRYWIPLITKKKVILLASIIIGLLFLTLLISLGLTASRGAWLAFGLSSIGLAFLLRKIKGVWGALSLVFLVFVIIGILCIDVRKELSGSRDIETELVAGKPSQEGVLSKKTSPEWVAKVENIITNSSRRGEYWSRAIDIIQRFPLFGCGYNAYIQTLKKLGLGPVEYPHNSLLQIAAELGLLGLLAHLWLFFNLFSSSISALKGYSSQKNFYIVGVGILGGLTAWLIHSITDTAWESLLLNILWWLMIGVFYSMPAIARNSNIQKGKV